MAARPQDPKRLCKCGVDSRHVANAESDRVGVEALVGECERLGVAFDKTHHISKAALPGALAADLEHVGVDVADGDMRAGAARSCNPKGDIAGAARNIQNGERLFAAWR